MVRSVLLGSRRVATVVSIFAVFIKSGQILPCQGHRREVREQITLWKGNWYKHPGKRGRNPKAEGPLSKEQITRGSSGSKSQDKDLLQVVT